MTGPNSKIRAGKTFSKQNRSTSSVEDSKETDACSRRKRWSSQDEYTLWAADKTGSWHQIRHHKLWNPKRTVPAECNRNLIVLYVCMYTDSPYGAPNYNYFVLHGVKFPQRVSPTIVMLVLYGDLHQLSLSNHQKTLTINQSLVLFRYHFID